MDDKAKEENAKMYSEVIRERSTKDRGGESNRSRSARNRGFKTTI